MDLLLKNLKWINGETRVDGDVRIRKGIIKEMGSSLLPNKRERVLFFDNHYLYRGLINAHDHLEMNLYPNLGRPPYGNYTEWANEIYKPGESPVREIESIPLQHRLLWGGIKNLISGVTTVVHHNPLHRLLTRGLFPVRVLMKCCWAHSLAFDKNVVRKFPRQAKTPYIIHAAEGVDDFAHGEIRKLRDLGLLEANTVLVHAVGLGGSDMDLIAAAKASVVWCPSSNLFMFGRSADVSRLKKVVRVALGSDSTMTGKGTFFEEMQSALKTGQATAREIFEMSTSNPEEMFKLPRQRVEVGSVADLLVLPVLAADYFENLVQHSAERVTAVFVNGQLRYGEGALADELNLGKKRFKIGKESKWMAYDVPELMNRVSKKASPAILQRNSLWKLFTS